MAESPIRLAIVGAGSRGNVYASFASQYPERARVVAIADPRQDRLATLAATHSVPQEFLANDWSALPNLRGIADAVVVATPDQVHTAPAIHFANQGMHLLVEKPLSPTEAECREIVAAVETAGVTMAVGHVLRYTKYTRRLKEILASGIIGEIVSIQHLEPVGWWHQAHSFVRGNWRNVATSTFMLMAKSCHDIDWLLHIMDRPCEMVSSFGGLHHFKRSNQPKGAADRCLDCPKEIEQACPYSAKKIYLERLEKGQLGWPLDILALHPTQKSINTALREGDYGRCVYACDNDVVDHQVVNLQFAGGSTANFTMTAFTESAARKTGIFGTHGEITGDGRFLRILDFRTQEKTEIDTEIATPGGALSGHGGGDHGLMDSFITSLEQKDPSIVLSGPAATLQSHLLVFAAERARLERRVVML